MNVVLTETKNNIHSLFNRLTHEGYHGFQKLIIELGVNKETLEPFTSWSSEKYQRISLVRDECSELLLLCWKPGQGTPIHGHNEQECWVHILEGEMCETLYEKGSHEKIIQKRIFSKGEFTYLTDSIGYHKLTNDSSDVCLSLHLYAKPLSRCEVFNEEKERFETVELESSVTV